ncbi:MAG: transporter substrate-binding domain-containing protein, partial [Methanocorpusculum sp.]|nr:transporter substrate-binding domain-containing protein [Methanocorpusculum sp.]
MKNKKLITGLMILATIILIVSAGCIASKPTYVIGMDAALSPWEVMGSDGNPQGINIDLINLIAKDQGFEIEYYVPEVGQWENDLVNKVIDTEGATVITPEREVKYAFAKMPFEPTRYLAIARADTGITLEDVLSGKASLAIFGTSVYEEWAKKQFGDEYSKMVEDGRIIIKDTADELAFAVLSRQVDSAIAG